MAYLYYRNFHIGYLIHNAQLRTNGWGAHVAICKMDSMDIPAAVAQFGEAACRNYLLDASKTKPVEEWTKGDFDWAWVPLTIDNEVTRTRGTIELFRVKRNYELRGVKEAPTEAQKEAWVMAKVDAYIDEMTNPPPEPEHPVIAYLRADGVTHVRRNDVNKTLDEYKAVLNA